MTITSTERRPLAQRSSHSTSPSPPINKPIREDSKTAGVNSTQYIRIKLINKNELLSLQDIYFAGATLAGAAISYFQLPDTLRLAHLVGTQALASQLHLPQKETFIKKVSHPWLTGALIAVGEAMGPYIPQCAAIPQIAARTITAGLVAQNSWHKLGNCASAFRQRPLQAIGAATIHIFNLAGATAEVVQAYFSPAFLMKDLNALTPKAQTNPSPHPSPKPIFTPKPPAPKPVSEPSPSPHPITPIPEDDDPVSQYMAHIYEVYNRIEYGKPFDWKKTAYLQAVALAGSYEAIEDKEGRRVCRHKKTRKAIDCTYYQDLINSIDYRKQEYERRKWETSFEFTEAKIDATFGRLVLAQKGTLPGAMKFDRWRMSMGKLLPEMLDTSHAEFYNDFSKKNQNWPEMQAQKLFIGWRMLYDRWSELQKRLDSDNPPMREAFEKWHLEVGARRDEYATKFDPCKGDALMAPIIQSLGKLDEWEFSQREKLRIQQDAVEKHIKEKYSDLEDPEIWQARTAALNKLNQRIIGKYKEVTKEANQEFYRLYHAAEKPIPERSYCLDPQDATSYSYPLAELDQDLPTVDTLYKWWQEDYRRWNEMRELIAKYDQVTDEERVELQNKYEGINTLSYKSSFGNWNSTYPSSQQLADVWKKALLELREFEENREFLQEFIPSLRRKIKQT